MSPLPWLTLVRNHPRSCGKDFSFFRRLLYGRESPPLVRERLPSFLLLLLFVGITPARAGKTILLFFGSSPSGNHPRSCGKDFRHSPVACNVWESPPLVRERPVYPRHEVKPRGITPARAGKTVTICSYILFCGNHPRSCGKDVLIDNYLLCEVESPPLVRERQ